MPTTSKPSGALPDADDADFIVVAGGKHRSGPMKLHSARRYAALLKHRGHHDARVERKR